MLKKSKDKECRGCRGSGKCGHCFGTGVITQGRLYKTDSDCPACSGYGTCSKCGGSGWLKRKFSISARIRCPKCGTIRPVISKHRPLRLDCDCGTVMILDK